MASPTVGSLNRLIAAVLMTSAMALPYSGCISDTADDADKIELAPAQARVLARTPCTGSSNADVMVRVGPLCVDKYEASVWSNPDGTGTQYPQSAPRFPATFPMNGNWTKPLYAVSRKGVSPAKFLTWFQAQQACALSGKRLLTNAEWQMAAAGTPDPGLAGDGTTTCNTNTTGPVATGNSPACVSNWGIHDMVGNLQEWTADWIQGPGINRSGVISAWIPSQFSLSTAPYGDDSIEGINEAFHLEAPQTEAPNEAAIDGLPTAIIRGGLWTGGTGAGVFTLFAEHTPSSLDNGTGFRCAR